MKLSVVINTKNAAGTLTKALQSVRFADEIIVVDMKSSDETLNIAKKFTKHVFEHKDVGYVEPARNFAISKASGDWILILDADEEVPLELKKVITGILETSEEKEETADAYYIPRKNFIFGKSMDNTGWWPDYVLRLFKKGFVSWSDEIHCVPITKGVTRELPAVGEIALIHHNYKSVNQYLERLNRYTTIQATQLNEALESQEQEIDSSFIFRKFYSEFFARFFAHQGVNEGTHGTALSLLQGLSEACVAIKVWEQRGFAHSDTQQEEAAVTELIQFKTELSYWIADWNVKNSSGIKQLFWKIRRKLYI